MITIYYNADEADQWPHKMVVENIEEATLVLNLLSTGNQVDWEDYTAEELLQEYNIWPDTVYTGEWIDRIDLQILEENKEILDLELEYIYDSDIHRLWGGG